MNLSKRQILLLPVQVWLVLFIVSPFLIVLAYSFAQRGSYGEVVWNFTIQNYKNVFTLPFAKVAWLSLQLALWNTLLCLLAGYPLAYFMSKATSKGTQQLLMILILIPFWTNFLIRTYALALILGDEGLINQFLMAIGWISQPLDLIYSKKAMILGLVSNYLPFMVLPLFVSLEKQDKNLLEAATDLGASPLKAFARVTWPLSLPGVAAGALMVFIPSLGEFVIPDLLGGGKYLLLGNLLSQKFLITRDWPLGSALSIVMSVGLAGALFVFYREQEKSGSTI